MTAVMNKRAIGEKIHTSYKIIVVALPESNDEYITVCPVIFPIMDGTIYYDDNTAEILDSRQMLQDAFEKAKMCMPRISEDAKLSFVYAGNDWHDNGSAKKANEKLICCIRSTMKTHTRSAVQNRYGAPCFFVFFGVGTSI